MCMLPNAYETRTEFLSFNFPIQFYDSITLLPTFAVYVCVWLCLSVFRSMFSSTRNQTKHTNTLVVGEKRRDVKIRRKKH